MFGLTTTTSGMMKGVRRGHALSASWSVNNMPSIFVTDVRVDWKDDIKLQRLYQTKYKS